MHRLIGVFLVALSAALFAANPIFARIGYDAGANTATYLFMRFLFASPLTFLIMKLQGDSIPRGKLLVSLILLGGISVGTVFCFFMAIRLAPVNLIIIITYMYPTIVTMFSSVILKEPITGFKIAALLLTIVGILLAIGVDSGGYISGILLAIGTACFHSFYLIFGSISIQKAGPFSASTVVILTTLVVFGIVLGVQGPQWPVTTSGWLAIITSGLVSTALARIIFFAGLRRIEIANASIISTLEAVVAIILAIIILGETITVQKVLGAGLVISAVIILAKREYETAHPKISHTVPR